MIAAVQVLLVAVLIVLVLAVATVALRRRRRRVWRAFAHRHGFEYHSAEGRHPEVEGAIDGRRLQLRVVPMGSDRGWLAMQPVRLSLELDRPVPEGLVVESRVGIESILGVEDLATGDATFDRNVRVAAEDHAAAVAYFDQERRLAVRELVETAPPAVAGLCDGAVWYQIRRAVSRSEDLERGLELLRRTASRLDG
jgi:hypothetical protein